MTRSFCARTAHPKCGVRAIFTWKSKHGPIDSLHDNKDFKQTQSEVTSSRFNYIGAKTKAKKNKKSRSEEFHFGDSLMLLPYSCLAPHHLLSGTPSSHVWNPTCIFYAITCIWYTTTCIWYPTIPVWYPTCVSTHHMTGTPPLSVTPSCVWNPIPSPTWYPTPVPHPTILPAVPHPHLAIVAPTWSLTTPYPLI